MARINIEEKYWTDPRREKLTRIVGDELLADGAVIRLWRLAQEYWANGRRTIPEHVFEHVRFRSELVQAGFVVVREQDVLVRGCSEAFQWIVEAKEKNSKAGKISAQKRKEKYGSASPKANAPRTVTERPRTESNVAEPSLSSSPSSSSSSSFSFSEGSNGSQGEPLPQKNKTAFNRIVWEHYRKLVIEKFKTEPVRNAMVNSQISHLTKSIPEEDVLPLLDFFFKSTNPFYVTNYFQMAHLVKDANKLHLQMKSGVKVNDTRLNGKHSPETLQDHNRQVAEKYLQEHGNETPT